MCTPLFEKSNESLETIFIHAESVIGRALSLFAGEATMEQIYRLQEDAREVKERYSQWPEGVFEAWCPKIVGHVGPNDSMEM